VSDEKARRVGLNEALFRQVNEEIRSLTDTFGEDLPTMTVVCECGLSDCAEQIQVEVSEYERIRADGRMYMVAPGHVFPELETVVESHDGWEVVQKHEGTPAELAQELDPRA
jgi:hypothetical protein